MNQKKVLGSYLLNRGNLIEIVVVAVFLGIGIEFICSSVYAKIDLPHKNLYFFSAGLLLCLLSLIFLFAKFFGTKTVRRNVKGFFIFDRENKSIVSIENYHYSNELEANLNAAISEDKAIDIDWKNSSFSHGEKDSKILNGRKIINELTEYYLLNLISVNLVDFFNDSKVEQERIIKIGRNDIPSILLNNRFLELFSKPMHQRAAFKDDSESDAEDANVKVVASFSNGALFQHFDLVLPKDSVVNKDSKGRIVIKTDRFELICRVTFDNMNASIPLGYEEYFLNVKNPFQYMPYSVSISLEFNLKFGALLKRSGWDYYNWVDALFESIENKFSRQKYFKKIAWNKAYPIIKAIKGDIEYEPIQID